MVKTLVSSNEAAPHNRLQLISAVLGNRIQMLWKCYLCKEAKILEQQGKAKGFEASKDQIFGKGHYSNS